MSPSESTITFPSTTIGDAPVPNSTTGVGSGLRHTSFPLKSYASTPNDPNDTYTRSPSVHGVGDAGLAMRCVDSNFSAGATTRHSSCPSARSRQNVMSLPSASPVRKILSPQIQGDEWPNGTPTFHF